MEGKKMNPLKASQRIIAGTYLLIKSKHQHRQNNIWVFGEWFGEKCNDNCMYLANYVANQYPNIKIFWVTKPGTDISRLSKRISVIAMDSKTSFKVLAQAGVAVVGQNFYDLSSTGYNYVQGACTVLLWHGVPWKRIGYDATCSMTWFIRFYDNLIDVLQSAKFYLTLSDKYSKVLETAYHAHSSSLIKAGYPRNSIFYYPIQINEARQFVLSKLSRLTNIKLSENTKIITYMPTFRNNGTIYSFHDFRNGGYLNQLLEKYNAIIVQKAHYVNQKLDNSRALKTEARIIDLDDIDAQRLLCATDLLITDYSSCFFDYLLLDRPVVYFLYDYEYYRDRDRGLYYPKEDVVAGSVAANEEELIKDIFENLKYPNLYKKRREKIRSEFLTYENISNCESITKQIFEKLKK